MGVSRTPRPTRPPAALALFGLALAALPLSACDPPPRTSQSTPEAALDSAVELVESGHAEKLTDLVYADTPRLRALLDSLGVLLGDMGDLAEAVQQHCPEEVERLKQAADERVRTGSVESLFAGFGIGGGKGGDAGRVLARLYADPYGWLRRGADRISFVTLTDDTAMIHFDDHPALSVLGISMKLEKGKWYLQLPTNLAGKYMPRTEEQWRILESIIQVFDGTARDLTAKVRGGDIRSLSQLGDTAEERLLIPAAIAFGAYAKEIDVREHAEKSMRRYRSARDAWETWRASAGSTREGRRAGAGDAPGQPEVSSALRRIMDKVALVQLEHAARMEERIDFESMTPQRFEELLSRWLAFQGVPVNLKQGVAGAELDAALEAWEKATPTLREPTIHRDRSDEPLRWLRRPE